LPRFKIGATQATLVERMMPYVGLFTTVKTGGGTADMSEWLFRARPITLFPVNRIVVK